MDAALNDQPLPDDEPQQVDPGAMDSRSLAQQVARDLEDLLEHAQSVNDDLLGLTTDFEWEGAATVLNLEDEVPWSPNELLAQLNGIAATAYRLARSVHPLIEARTRHLVARADRELG